jgi:mannose-6-phosphate isomerase-like protein (cupin superfamily)
MIDPLCDLTRSIVVHLAGRGAAEPDMESEIQHLHRAVQYAAVKHEFDVRPRGEYDATLALAIALGLHDGVAEIAAALAAIPRALPWDYQYPPHPSAGDLAKKIGFAELIGPDGPMYAPQCRVGFTLLAADTFYPSHAHPAIELYLVIAGHAEWTASNTRQVVAPGGFVLHRSNEPHAMRTQTEPLLALYSWSGNLDTAAFYI